MINNKLQQPVFVSLGGLEEIGLNCYLYGNYSKKITNYIMVDLGIGFRDSKFTFVDTFIPDISMFKEKNNKLKALFLTHGHEDHIGAIEYHYKDISKIPIYATPFTADLVRSKLKYHNILNPNIIEVEFGKKYLVDAFTITFLPIEHSIPESSMLLIEMKNLAVIHSGDFKINPNTFSNNSFSKYLPETINYLFCDSTNSDKNKDYKLEQSILADLNKIIQEAKETVWVTLFSSNVERLGNLIETATNNNKKIVLLGASVRNYYNIASKHGYIKSSNVISIEDIKNYNNKDLLYIVSGSQGEPNSFLQRILQQEYNGLKIKKDDRVVFLSKVIPGNEVKVSKLYNNIADKDALLYTSTNYNLHVSGHAYANQVEMLIQEVNPKYVIPIHGEKLQLKALYKIAQKLGYNTSIFQNGDLVSLLDNEPNIIDNIPFNKLSFEGFRNLSLADAPLRERRRIMFDGVVFISLIVKKYIIQKDIKVNIVGLLTEDEKLKYIPKLNKEILSINKDLSKKQINSTKDLKDNTKKIVKKFFKLLLKKRPHIIVESFYY